MRFQKRFLFFTLILLICAPNQAAERRKPLPIDELRNPMSPSFVPVPYPKTRDEVIVDLKYAIDLHHGSKKTTKRDDKDELLMKFLAPNPIIHISEIDKVQNRTIDFPDDFFFLIIFTDDMGNKVASLSLEASGLYVGGMRIKKTESATAMRNQVAAIKTLSSLVNTSGVKSMERIFMANRIAPYPFLPAWEITTLNHVRYYLDENGKVFRLREKMPHIQGIENSIASSERNPSEIVVHDQLNDELLVLDGLN